MREIGIIEGICAANETMRPFTFPFVLLFAAVLNCEAANGDTLELLRRDAPLPSKMTDRIGVGEQKRYRIQTEHYEITATQFEGGNFVSDRLEHLTSVLTRLVAEYGKEVNSEPAPHRHRVILYRDHQEYTLHLFQIDRNIARTNGYYSTPKKTAYFPSLEEKVLFHEGTHQIFAERFFHEKAPAFRNNFWVVEGIALFMETLKIEDECYKIGNILANRLYSAKKYRFEQNHRLPIRKLTAMSAAEIQTNVDLQKIYSQSATLVHWLMFAEEGRYRPALFELLRRTYLGSATPETLSELTGLSYDELDKKYEEFLKTIPDE